MKERLRVAVFTQSADLFAIIRTFVPPGLAEFQLVSAPETAVLADTAIAFIDAKWSNLSVRVLEQLGAQGVHRVIVEEARTAAGEVPEVLTRGLVDDALLVPIRAVEVLSKLRHAAHLEGVKELTTVNSDLKALITKFDEDLRTARTVQRSLIPEKFPPLHGLRVTHKYLSGLKSGGDYLDFFEFEDKNHVGMLMSDSTGYGLSSALMSVILKLAMRLSKDGSHSPAETIRKIFEELRLTMKPKESLSLYYGILNRKTFELSYSSCGTIQLIHQSGKKTSGLLVAIDPLTKDRTGEELKDRKVHLEPEDRIIIFSDGFGNALAGDGDGPFSKVFTNSYGDDPVALINELTYRVKSKFETADDMPEQDCSVMVLDVEKRAMRLAR